MTEGELLEHVFEGLSRAETGGEILGADEARQWPDGARVHFLRQAGRRGAHSLGA